MGGVNGVARGNFQQISYIPLSFIGCTVKPPNKGQIRDEPFVPYRGCPLLRVFLVVFLKCIIPSIYSNFDGFFNSKMARAILLT